MEIKITTHQLLKVLQLLSWIIFIGLCIEAGGTAVNTFTSLLIRPDWVENFWEGTDYLSSLYTYDYGHFLVVTVIMTIVAVLKAVVFYLIIRLFSSKKINLSQPFNTALRQFIFTVSYLSLAIGLFSYSGFKFTVWLSEQGFAAADLQALHIAGADVWLFMSVILYVIVQLVKRGIELQEEIELTI